VGAHVAQAKRLEVDPLGCVSDDIVHVTIRVAFSHASSDEVKIDLNQDCYFLSTLTLENPPPHRHIVRTNQTRARPNRYRFRPSWTTRRSCMADETQHDVPALHHPLGRTADGQSRLTLSAKLPQADNILIRVLITTSSLTLDR